MIISASRRTDIPTYYSQWMMNRFREGYALVRNPMNPRQVSRITLSPDVVDGVVFWTKNPIPMLDKLDGLRDYMYVFQFTLNAYGRDIEGNLPDKGKAIIPAFMRLSDRIGPDRVIWRYDPILLGGEWTIDRHAESFALLARRLHPYTRKVTISYLDMYRSMSRHAAAMGIRALTPKEQEALGQRLAQIAHSHGLAIDTCAEGIDLARYGIGHGHCIDRRLFERLLGCELEAGKDKNQRAECGCMESIDIGAYNTCPSGCGYCYANHSARLLADNAGCHDPASPMLLGALMPGDRVTERRMVSFKRAQLRFDL